MQKVIVTVPDGTIPRRAGEKYMACILKDNGELEKCTDFFKSKDEAEKFAEKNPEYLMYGVNYFGEMPKGTVLRKVPKEVAQ